MSSLHVRTSSPSLQDILSKHPLVRKAELAPGPLLEFHEGAWQRRLHEGRYDIPLCGLVEMMDNNPIVCADEMSVPDPAGTLALIALGPLARAGLIQEEPVLLLSFEADPQCVSQALRTEGYFGNVLVQPDPQDLGDRLAATALVQIATPEDLDDIDSLYEEAFGRSFYIREDSASPWDVKLVANRPHALYRLAVTPDDPTSLLRVQTMADRHGKCGDMQVVHAFNVMIGCEETLGIPDSWAVFA